MEHPNVQSLLQSGSPQGRSYLAQQLTQRGAIPGGGLGQTAAQQPKSLCSAMPYFSFSLG